jgi:SAM-dependent methyltransferase
MPHFSPKTLPDGRAMLNLGCGWKMHRGWTNLDFSPYARLAKRPALARLLARLGLLSPLRQERLALVDPEMVCWDLRHGIPYADETFDVVYHSHFLEHLERKVAGIVLTECRRVLKKDGVIRVVVPDWETLVAQYRRAFEVCDRGEAEGEVALAKAMEDMIEQMVRSKAAGARGGPLLAWFENWFRGGAAGAGELHRWMYDRHSLSALLRQVGFRDPAAQTLNTSAIAGWNDFGLDVTETGRAYKSNSLYLEARK